MSEGEATLEFEIGFEIKLEIKLGNRTSKSKSEPKLKTYWTHIDSVDGTINIGCAHQCCFDNSHSESKKASYLITKIKTILF